MNRTLPEVPENISQKVKDEPWEYADADTRHLTHNIHRYSGKFIPQIPARAIGLLTEPGELILDPYCGSGTTLLESALLGRRAIGIDLNPLAILIAKVKTTPIPQGNLAELMQNVAAALPAYRTDKECPLFAGSERPTDVGPKLRHADWTWYRKWFQPHVLEDLLLVNSVIEDIEHQGLKDVARVAFSDILRRSSNAHSGYPNVMFDKNAPTKGSPIPLFVKTLKRNVSMVASLSNVRQPWPSVNVIRGDAKALPMPSDSVDAVITHPPYIGSVPYAEYGALSIRWLGADPKEIDRQLTGGRRQLRDIVQRFKADYRQMIREVRRVLRPGRHAFLMVGSPVIRGEPVNLSEITMMFAADVGLELVAHAERHGINRRANNMGAEQLLFFRKPA